MKLEVLQKDNKESLNEDYCKIRDYINYKKNLEPQDKLPI
jgi:hypothetical protein